MADRKEANRKERVYRRRSAQERGRQAAADADQRRLGSLQHELTLAQLDAVSEGDRSSDWQAQRDQAQQLLDGAETQAKALDKRAETLLGAPFSAEEKRNRKRTLEMARTEALEAQLDSWEDTMASHERNLDVLEAVPVGQRDGWRGDLRGVTGAEAEGMAWQEAWDANDQALDTYERAVNVAAAALESLRPAAEGST